MCTESRIDSKKPNHVKPYTEIELSNQAKDRRDNGLPIWIWSRTKIIKPDRVMPDMSNAKPSQTMLRIDNKKPKRA